MHGVEHAWVLYVYLNRDQQTTNFLLFIQRLVPRENQFAGNDREIEKLCHFFK